MVNGKMGKNMEKEHTYLPMEIGMLENGKTTNILG